MPGVCYAGADEEAVKFSMTRAGPLLKDVCGDCDSPYHDGARTALIVCFFLCALYCMHIYWYCLFLRIAWGLGEGKDPKKVGEEQYHGDEVSKLNKKA